MTAPGGKSFTVRVPKVGALTVSIRTVLELIAAVIAVAVLGIRGCQLDRARAAAGKAGLEADTLRASLDSTRVVAIGVADSLRAVQRQVIQVKAEKDDTDKRLGLERIARAQLTAQVQRLEVIVNSSAPVTESAEGVRSAKFVVDSAPYFVTATVDLARPPGVGTIALSVNLDPINLEARQGCGPANAAGIRSAFLTVIGPTWATVNLERVEQDPGLCRSPALEPVHGDGRAWWRKAIDRVGVSAGLGATAGVGIDGKPSTAFGLTIVAGVKVWP